MTDYHKKTKTELVYKLKGALDALAICSDGLAVIRLQKQNAELKKHVVDKINDCDALRHKYKEIVDCSRLYSIDLESKCAELDAANKSLSAVESENAELKIDALYNEKEITRLEGKVTGLAVALEIAMESIK